MSDRSSIFDLSTTSDLQLTEIRPPGVVHELQPVAFGEISQVGDEGSDEEDVPTQSPLLYLEVFHGLRPANFLGCQTSHLKHSDTDKRDLFFFYFTTPNSPWSIL